MQERHWQTAAMQHGPTIEDQIRSPYIYYQWWWFESWVITRICTYPSPANPGCFNTTLVPFGFAWGAVLFRYLFILNQWHYWNSLAWKTCTLHQHLITNLKVPLRTSLQNRRIKLYESLIWRERVRFKSGPRGC